MVCSVVGCSTRSSYKKSKVHYYLHPFPADDKSKRYRDWLQQINRKGFKPTKATKVCSRHFTKDDYLPKEQQIGTRGKEFKIPRLKPSAVPTLYLTPDARHDEEQPETSTAQGNIFPPVVCQGDALVKDTQNVQHDHLYHNFMDIQREEEDIDSNPKVLPSQDSITFCEHCAEYKLEIMRLKAELKAKDEKLEYLEKVETAVKKVHREDGIKRLLKPKAFVKWSDMSIRYAIHIYYMVGTTGFNFLKEELHWPLPTVRTLQNHLKDVSIRPRLLKDFFFFMEKKVKFMAREDCFMALLVDEMGIKPGRQYDMTTQSFVGHPTMKAGPALMERHAKNEDDMRNVLATKAQPYMIVGLGRERFKQVVAIDFTEDSFDAKECAAIMKSILQHSVQIGLIPKVIITDMGPSNLSV